MSARLSWSLLLSLLIAFAQMSLQVSNAASDATPEAIPAAKPVFAIQQAAPGSTSYFSIDLEAGQSTTLNAVVRTVDSMPLALRAYATNAFSKVNGGFGAGTEEDLRTEPATWIDFPAQSFQLGATEERDISFTVKVPDDTPPGQYVAALVAQTDGPLPIEGTEILSQIIRSAIAVVITVPGTMSAGFSLGVPTITPTSGNGMMVIPIANTGNILVKPEGRITIANSDGVVVTDAPVKMNSVYAGNATTIEFLLPEQFEAGDYIVSGTLTDPATKATATLSPTTVTYIPSKDVAPVTFSLDPVTIAAVGDPVQFANIEITVNNQGSAIPTAKVVLKVSKDGAPVEDYVLTQNQAMPNGTSTISQRYIPATGFTSGTYSFELVVMSVDANGAETTILTLPVDDTIVVP